MLPPASGWTPSTLYHCPQPLAPAFLTVRRILSCLFDVVAPYYYVTAFSLYPQMNLAVTRTVASNFDTEMMYWMTVQAVDELNVRCSECEHVSERDQIDWLFVLRNPVVYHEAGERQEARLHPSLRIFLCVGTPDQSVPPALRTIIAFCQFWLTQHQWLPLHLLQQNWRIRLLNQWYECKDIMLHVKKYHVNSLNI